MIIRILGEGQFRVDDAVAAELQTLDSAVEAAVEHNDEDALTAALSALLACARSKGQELPADSLEPSDVIIPHEGATLDEVRQLITDEGLIPG